MEPILIFSDQSSGHIVRLQYHINIIYIYVNMKDEKQNWNPIPKPTPDIENIKQCLKSLSMPKRNLQII